MPNYPRRGAEIEWLPADFVFHADLGRDLGEPEPKLQDVRPRRWDRTGAIAREEQTREASERSSSTKARAGEKLFGSGLCARLVTAGADQGKVSAVDKNLAGKIWRRPQMPDQSEDVRQPHTAPPHSLTRPQARITDDG